MTNPPFPEPRFIDTGALRMAIYEQGEGTPVILCHGFPEIAYSWRHQIPALAQAGFRAIAPDQRGYGLTGRPKNEPKGEAAVPLYDMEHLTGDLIGLLDALEIEKAIFAGHDWGGIVIWQLPILYPERVAGIIGVNTPYLPRPKGDPIAFMRKTMGEDMYIVYFQKYGAAEAVLEKDIPLTMKFWYRKAGKRPPRDNNSERSSFAFIKAFEAGPEHWPGEPLLSPEEQAVYCQAFERTGYTGPINWYRNFTRNWEQSEGQKEHIACPCLMISAADDAILRPELADRMGDYIPDLEKHIIADCGHWTQQEQPQELNRLMTGWLTKRFTK